MVVKCTILVANQAERALVKDFLTRWGIEVKEYYSDLLVEFTGFTADFLTAIARFM